MSYALCFFVITTCFLSFFFHLLLHLYTFFVTPRGISLLQCFNFPCPLFAKVCCHSSLFYLYSTSASCFVSFFTALASISPFTSFPLSHPLLCHCYSPIIFHVFSLRYLCLRYASFPPFLYPSPIIIIVPLPLPSFICLSFAVTIPRPSSSFSHLPFIFVPRLQSSLPFLSLLITALLSFVFSCLLFLVPRASPRLPYLCFLSHPGRHFLFFSISSGLLSSLRSLLIQTKRFVFSLLFFFFHVSFSSPPLPQVPKLFR